MNNKMSLPYLIIIIAPLFFAYRGPLKENNASANFVLSSPIGDEKYTVNTKESVVTWKCSMALAGKGGHHGYITLSKGELTIEEGRLVGGAIEVDMKTIEDESHRSDNNLIAHLKDADFFDVNNFPISTFVITKVAPADGDTLNVTGNLTIKGITHEVTFPAQVYFMGQKLAANGKMTIDRTKWNVRYGSEQFFDNLADRAISDDIEFQMNIVAGK